MLENRQPQEPEIAPYATFFDILTGIKLIGTLYERAKTVGKLLDSIDNGYSHIVLAGHDWSGSFFHKDNRAFVKDDVTFWFARHTVIAMAPARFKEDCMKLIEQAQTVRTLNEKRDMLMKFKDYSFNFLIYKSSSTACYFTYSNSQHLQEVRDVDTYEFWTFSLHR
ncbi:hypothetical protein FGO68_gene4092 [Halteria grandinella]|uniref:Uncharacterized protein n=1 Tax=Halteria grandinella TaxID=5974 RepID=A0A8J8NNA7_HALGN|nr:hypothetical protein FGO68_gene4092 [Halteria grandinella]